MKSRLNFWTWILVILYAIILIWNFVLLMPLLRKVDEVNPTFGAAFFLGSVTISGIFISRYIERQKIIEQQIREKKIPIYEKFTEFLLNIITNLQEMKVLSQKEITEFFYDFNKEVIIWFPDDVLKTYLEWKNILMNEKNNKQRLGVFSEKLLLAIRKDIGHSNKGLKENDLSKLFITADIVEIFKEEK